MIAVVPRTTENAASTVHQSWGCPTKAPQPGSLHCLVILEAGSEPCDRSGGDSIPCPLWILELSGNAGPSLTHGHITAVTRLSLPRKSSRSHPSVHARLHPNFPSMEGHLSFQTVPTEMTSFDHVCKCSASK